MNEDRTSLFMPTVGRLAGVAVSGVLLAMLLATAGCDRFLSAEGRIERAAELYEAGRYADAMRDAKTALEAEPDNVEGRVLLARIALRIGDAASAAKELDRAVASGADPASVSDLHYDIMLAQGRFEDVLVAVAVDDGIAPARKHFLVATAQTALGRHDEARQSIDEALKLEPGSRDLALLEARWFWSSGRAGDARKVLDRLTTADPQDAEAWLMLGRLALGSGDASGAVAAFEKSRASAETRLSVPDQLGIRVGLVEAQLVRGETAAAEAALKDLGAKARDAFVTRYLRARIAYLKGDYRAASAELQRALSQQPNSVPARLLLGAALFDQGSAGQAEAELSRLVSEQPGNIEARKLLARVLVARNDLVGARRVLANAPSDSSRESGAEWLSGAILVLGGQTPEGVALLEQASAADPNNVPLKLDLARAYLAAGRREDALAVLSALPANEGGPRRRQLEVMAEVTGRSLAEAREGVRALVRANDADSELLVVAGSWLLGAGDVAAAVDAFGRAVSADGKSVDARLGLAAATWRAGDRARSEAELRKILEIDPTAERAYAGLAGQALVAGDKDAAKRWLEQAIGANPAAVDARLQLARLALLENDPARMKSLAEQALTASKARPATLNRVGLLLMQGSMYDEALQRFNEASAAGVEEAGINAALTLVALGRRDEARSRLEELSSRRRDWGAPVAYLAGLDSGEGRFQAALARVDAFEKAGGASPIADEIRGDVYLAWRQPQRAVEALERVDKSRPSSPIALKLFSARRAAGSASPENGLLAWLQRDPTDVAARVTLAEYLQQIGDRKGAIGQYERAVAQLPNPVVINNLAWLYYETGDSRAEDLALRAYRIMPQDAAIADTYGWILVEKGKVEEGLPVLEKAAKAAPGHGDIQYHYAAALARAGRKDEAARALSALLEKAPQFATRADAEKLLESLGGS